MRVGCSQWVCSELVISWGVDRLDPCEFSSPFIRSLIFCPLLPVRCNEHLVGGNYRETVNQQVSVVCVSEVPWWVQKERKKQLCHGGADAIPPQETFREGGRAVCCWLAGVRAQGRMAEGLRGQGGSSAPAASTGSLEFVSVRELAVVAQPQASPSQPSTPPR